MTTQNTGIVTWFNTEKGFGYIKDTESGNDIFVHYTELETEGLKTLHEGQEVAFEKAVLAGRDQAVKVTLA